MRAHKRRWSVIGALALVLSTLAIGVANAPFASADTSQNNACLGVTGTFSTFPVPITGTATAIPGTTNPGSATLGVDTISLSGSSVTIGVDSVLIGAGVTTGLVSAADSLADIGAYKNDDTGHTTVVPTAGVDAVTAAVGSVTLKITGSNTAEGTQTASNTAPVALTFYVTADSAGGSVVVYSSISTPPSTTPDPGRTGTALVGALIVPIPLSDTTWNPTGGAVNFTEAQVTPSTFTAGSLTPADKGAAPLLIGPKINGSINVPFICWAGTASVDGLSFSPAASGTIASEPVVAPPTAPNCSPTTRASSVGGGQSTNVTPSCTDVNSDFTASNTSVIVAPGTATAPVGQNPCAAGPPACLVTSASYPNAGDVISPAAPSHGTVSVSPSGVITYANDGLGASSDSFQFVAVDTAGNVSQTVTVNVSVLNNQCTAGDAVSTPGCSLRQVLILPILPSTLSMTEGHQTLANPGGGDFGNPSFSQAILGGVLDATNTCNPGPVQLNGQPQTACGILNSITVVNARGTDTKWDVTAQVTDFVDGTRPPGDSCSATKNIEQSPKNNHCIPGDNLGWVPMAQILDPSVPGDTAATTAGGVILPPVTTAQTPPAFPPSPLVPRTNTNSVLPAYSILNLSTPGPGLHDVAQALCGAPVNQSGGTFQCDAGLLLAVPGSAAAGTYTATITLTLA